MVDRELSTVSISTNKQFHKGEDVEMTYNKKMLDTFILLEHYGFVVENNMFATIALTVSNI